MKVQALATFFSATLSVLALPLDPAAQYEGIKVLRVPTGPDTEPLDELISYLNLERWTPQLVPNSYADIQVPQDRYDALIVGLEGLRTKEQIREGVVTMHNDLAKSIREESKGMYTPHVDPLVGLANDDWFNTYHRYASHLQFLHDLVSTYPNNSKIVSGGTSFEGNDITGINIFGSGGSGTKPAIIIHGTVHAREWITNMVTEGFAYNLLTGYSSSTEVKSYVDKYDFYFFPVVNPDGYEHSHTATRLWRKNRSATPSVLGCRGIDINRNWIRSFGGPGSSSNPCADTYRGPFAESAPETKGLASFITARVAATGVKMYMDVHSYGQLFMTPYGYTCSKIPADATELNAIAAGYISELEKLYGTHYESGSICDLKYPASGTAVDYVYDDLGVKYSFAMELRDNGRYGFVLPPSQIRPSVDENWAGFKYLLENMK